MWLAILLLLASLGAQAPAPRPVLTAGLFLGRIEEGARIMGPIRLLPFEHPESLGHEFPNQQQLHTAEYEVLCHLGRLVGLQLEVTLQRYPARPTSDWPYAEFDSLPAQLVLRAEVRRAAAPSRVAGMRAVAYRAGEPLAFLLDTRFLTLEQRGMSRPTTMGLDLTRAQLLERLRADAPAADGIVVVLFPQLPGAADASVR